MYYLIGNWKMNPEDYSDALDLGTSIDRELDNLSDDLFVGVTPPFVFLNELKSQLINASLGAQDSFWKNKGAFTGEVSPSQLKSAGVEYVILGHSERRLHLNESEEYINKKVINALESGLRVVLCVGEPADVRNGGSDNSKTYVENQIKSNLSGVDKRYLKKLIIAYEPVWAISTFEESKPADPDTAEEMVSFIKSLIEGEFSRSVPVIYGGSTDSENVRSFVSKPSIDGCLPGSASLDHKEFIKMVNIILEEI